jgi:ABC-2 type transport system ATP-binding protein
LPSVLEVFGLAKRYGEVWAVREVSLRLDAGSTLVLLGQNGAGKTTALRCMSGVLRPTSGRVTVDGLDVAQEADSVRARVGFMPEVPGLYERMTADGYLDYFGRIYGLEAPLRGRRIAELLDRFDLASAAGRWLGSYSKGMRQKVALIRATLHRPRLVLADEPTSALDPASAHEAWAYLEELRRQGSALVVCTHNMEEAESLAGQIGVMARGRLLAAGDLPALVRASGLKSRKEVVEKPSLAEVYLALVGGIEREARPA